MAMSLVCHDTMFSWLFHFFSNLFLVFLSVFHPLLFQQLRVARIPCYSSYLHSTHFIEFIILFLPNLILLMILVISMLNIAKSMSFEIFLLGFIPTCPNCVLDISTWANFKCPNLTHSLPYLVSPFTLVRGPPHTSWSTLIQLFALHRQG